MNYPEETIARCCGLSALGDLEHIEMPDGKFFCWCCYQRTRELFLLYATRTNDVRECQVCLGEFEIKADDDTMNRC
jgi:hypothetical protein